MKSVLDVVGRQVVTTILLVMALVPLSTAFAAPLLNLAITANGPVAPGQNVTFTVTLSNTGDTTTNGFNLFATVPNNTLVPGDQDEGALCSGTGSFGGDCLAGQSLSWNVSLTPGQSLSRTFTAVVDNMPSPPDGTTITSTASTSLGLSVDGSVIVRSASGLNARLDATPNSVPAGGEYRYTLTYGNAKASTVNTNLSFSLPAGASIVSASDGGVISVGQVTWNTGNLPAGASGIREVIAQVPPVTSTGTLILAGARLTDRNGVEPEATADIVTTVGTPLEISVSTLPDPVQPGQSVSYVITVSNLGNSTTNGFNLFARVPNHTLVPGDQDEGALCSGTGSFGGDCLAGQSLSWNVSLTPGESLSRTFTAVVDSTTPPANGTLLSTVVNTDFDGGGAVTGAAVVGDPGPTLALDGPPGSVAAGGSYTYTLTYGNAGTSPVDGEVSLRLPVGATFQSATGGGTVAGDVVTWNIGTLAAGQADRQQVTLQAPASSPTGTLLIAEAQLRDPSTLQSFARASASTTVGTPLEISVSTLPDPVQPGQSVSYVITVSNLGSSTTNGFNLFARVPNHTLVPGDQDEGALCSGTGSFGGDCLAGQSLSWNVSLTPGESLSRTFTAVVDSTTPPANGTLLSTVVNTDFDGGGAVTGEAVVGVYRDTDGDGIPNKDDNCILAPNGPNQPDAGGNIQLDTDADGIGNVCDCDFNNDNFCGGPDFTLFIGCFNRPVGSDSTCQAADMNGDGFVGGPDFTLFIGGFNGPPGP